MRFKGGVNFKPRNKHPLKSKTFKQMAGDYQRKAARDTAEERLSKGWLGLVEGTLRRYLVPFFGARTINNIGQADFSEYDDWRLSYWTSGAGPERRTANAGRAWVTARGTAVGTSENRILSLF